MATSKRDSFGKAENDIARLAKALSHPARVNILLETARRQTCTGSELQALIPLSQSTIAQHLKDLLKAGLLLVLTRGPKSVYAVNWPEFERHSDALTQFLEQLSSFEYR